MHSLIQKFLVINLLIATFSFNLVYADSPTLINFRGHIADKPGTQSLQLEFNLYDVEVDGTPLWTETQAVDLFDGNFVVLLGSTTPLDYTLFNDPNRFLGVRIIDETELSPRQQIVTVPYAFQSDFAGIAENALTADQANDASMLGGINANQYIPRNTSNWLRSLGLSTQDVQANPNNLLQIAVPSENMSNADGITISGAPARGNVGMRLHNSGTGGREWFITATNNNNTDQGGGKLVFMRWTQPVIVPFSEDDEEEKLDSSSPNFQPSQIGSLFYWTSILTLNGTNNRVGIMTTNPQHTLSVHGTIGGDGVSYHSDERWKENIVTLDHPLEKVKQLRGVEYDWKRDENPEMHFSDGKQVGLIAQEVETILPEVVSSSDEGYKSVDYARIVPLLVESIKEQQKLIEQLQSRVDQLEQVTQE